MSKKSASPTWSWPRLSQAMRDERGSVAVMAALGMAILLGAAAIAVDMSYAYVVENRLQITADTAAMAAVSALPDTAAAQARAVDYAEKNMPVAAHGNVVTEADVETGRWDSNARAFSAGATPMNAVRVTARRTATSGNPLQLFFANAIGMGQTDVSAIAIATTGNDPICLLALDPSSDDALTLNSDATVDLENCAVQVNSSHLNALSTLSNAAVRAQSTCVVGYYSGPGSSYDPIPDTGCDAVADPLSGLAEPSSSPCDFDEFEGEDYTIPLDAGVYCDGLVLEGNSNTTFNAGTYVISGGTFHLGNNATVSGTDVVFFLTNGARLQFDSGSSVDFTAPDSGPYAGILFFQDPSDSGTHVINSTVNGVLEGVIYLPNGDLRSNSTTDLSGSSSCTFLVARRFDFDSSSGLDMTLDLNACSVPIPRALTGGNPKLAS